MSVQFCYEKDWEAAYEGSRIEVCNYLNYWNSYTYYLDRIFHILLVMWCM